MSIGILYESREWSNEHLAELISQAGITNELIDMETFCLDPETELPHDLYINRVFPSAEMRNHHNSIRATCELLTLLDSKNIPIINSFKAFIYDCDKMSVYKILESLGIPFPHSVYVETGYQMMEHQDLLPYPVVLKRNCGGRSWDTKILFTLKDLEAMGESKELIGWIIQKYVEPVAGFTTRIEIIGDKIIAVLKRFVGKGNISSYSTGSKYEIYENCNDNILETSINVLKTLQIEMGSVDVVETFNNKYYVIDVNSTSNFTLDYIPLLGFDPISKMADHVITLYRSTVTDKDTCRN